MVRKNLFLRPHIPPEKQQRARHYTHLFPWHWYSVSTSRNTLLRLCPACFSMIYGKNNICQILPPELKTPLSRSPLAERTAKLSPSQLQAQVWSRTWWHRPCGSVSKATDWPEVFPAWLGCVTLAEHNSMEASEGCPRLPRGDWGSQQDNELSLSSSYSKDLSSCLWGKNL